MAENSAIEWTDHTFNPWWGCVKVSPGCKNCYAETLSNRFGNWWGVDGERRFFGDKHWNEPLKWNRKAEKEGRRRRVFCGSMCDVFEIHKEWETTLKMDRARKRLGTIIKETPHLDWLLLSKRIGNIYSLCSTFGFVREDKEGIHFDFPKNVWTGTSIENQEQADIRIPELLKIPTRVRFLSMEPLLERVDLTKLITVSNYVSGGVGDVPLEWGQETDDIQWVIVGGESGRNKRPFDPDWARSIRDQCAAAEIPFFMKQWDKVKPIPADLMIREFPRSDDG